MQDNRKATRDALLGAKAARPSKVVEVNGRHVKLLQPMVGPYNDAMAPLLDDKGRVKDLSAFKFECIRLCSFDPESGDALFDASDRDAFRELPLACEWYETLATEAVLICTRKAKEDGEALGKTTADGSCSR